MINSQSKSLGLRPRLHESGFGGKRMKTYPFWGGRLHESTVNEYRIRFDTKPITKVD